MLFQKSQKGDDIKLLRKQLEEKERALQEGKVPLASLLYHILVHPQFNTECSYLDCVVMFICDNSLKQF